MLGGQNYRGTKYSRYMSSGQDNPLCQGPKATITSLTDFLADPIGSQEDKHLAAEILQWAVDREKSHPDLTFFLDLDAAMLWENPEYFAIREVERQGTTTRECVVINPSWRR